MKRTLIAATVLAAAVTAAPTQGVSQAHQPSPVPDTYVSAWDKVGSDAFTAAALSPAEGHIIFAYMSIAVYDAAMAIDKGYEPFAVGLRAPRGASAEAAVVAAARRVLAHYLPNQKAGIIDPAYDTSLATIPDGRPKADGVAVGEAAASALIALRQNDGFRVAVPYATPNPPIPGVWIPTAPPPAQPIGTYLGNMTPFSIRSADQFRPDGPPDLRSRRWAKDYNEVKELGSNAVNTPRTAEQTETARFWGEAPVQQARASFRRFISDHQLDVFDAARFMGMVSVTYADSFISCFDAKYHYTFWRPITAIRAGDTDDNDATVADTGWSPMLPATPNHPEYPSAHSCLTTGAGLVAARFLGTTEIDFTVPSLAQPGVLDRTFETPWDMIRDVQNGRVWGGIHFRSAVQDGATIAKRTAGYVLSREFRRTSSGRW
jgi:hypothetical protein